MKKILALITVLLLVTLMCGEVKAQSFPQKIACPSCCIPESITVSGHISAEQGLLRRGALGVAVYNIGSDATVSYPRVNAFGYFQTQSTTCNHTLVQVFLSKRGQVMYPNSAVISEPAQLFGIFDTNVYQDFYVYLIFFKEVG